MLSPFLLSYAPEEVFPARLFGASLDRIQEPIVGGLRGHLDLERRRASGQTAPMIFEPKLDALPTDQPRALQVERLRAPGSSTPRLGQSRQQRTLITPRHEPTIPIPCSLSPFVGRATCSQPSGLRWPNSGARAPALLDLEPSCRHGHSGANGHPASAREVELVGCDPCRPRSPTRAAG